MPARSSSKSPAPSNQPEPSEPHYLGHRERLRERFYSAGADALSDYELLEMALFPALPRRDTKPLAKTLRVDTADLPEVVGKTEEVLLTENKVRSAILGGMDPQQAYLKFGKF